MDMTSAVLTETKTMQDTPKSYVPKYGHTMDGLLTLKSAESCSFLLLRVSGSQFLSPNSPRLMLSLCSLCDSQYTL